MTGFELIASLAASLAWPLVTIALIVIAWANRNNISEALEKKNPDGTRRGIRRAKAGPLELEWDEVIQATEKKVEASESEAAGKLIEIDSGFEEKMTAVAELSPTAAVLESSAWLEQELRSFAERKHLDPAPVTRMSTPQLARFAYKNEAIDENIFSALQNMFRLRNEAAHRVGNEDISKDQAHEYINIANRVVNTLKNAN